MNGQGISKYYARFQYDVMVPCSVGLSLRNSYPIGFLSNNELRLGMRAFLASGPLEDFLPFEELKGC